MQQQQFIDIIKQPHHIESAQLAELEVLVKEYPFFESAHLLYTKGLHKYQAINYSKQLRKTAIVVNSRSILYELLHQPNIMVTEPVEVKTIIDSDANNETIDVSSKKDVGSVSVTDNDIKVIYVNTVSNPLVPEKEVVVLKETPIEEINIIKSIENETEVPVQEFHIQKLNRNIEQEISKGIIQSYVETDIIKTPELNKEEIKEPSSFTDWLKTIQKESHTFQIDVKKDLPEKTINGNVEQKKVDIDKKPSFFSKNKQIIDKIIESDPGRLKFGTTKFFTPASDAKQSLLENEHLVTETLAKIYALQGNISKAIRAYEILSLKFPQKSVYFATLIEKLKTNK